MSQSERIRDEIGWLKVLFGVVVALDASLVAWAVQHFDSAPPALLIGALLLVAVFTTGVIWINVVVYKRLAQLEKL